MAQPLQLGRDLGDDGPSQRLGVVVGVLAHDVVDDAVARDEFLSLLFAEAERSGATLLTVTHDEAVADRFDRRLALTEILAQARSGAAA